MKKLFCLIMIALIAYWFLVPNAYAQPVYSGQRLTVDNLTLTTADTEYSYTMPNGTLYFTIKARTSAAFKIAFSANASGSTYETVPAGAQWYSDHPLTLRDNRTFYVQSGTAGLVLEISTIQ